MFGLAILVVVVYVVMNVNSIDVGNLKQQFIDPYITQDIIYTAQNFVDVTMNAVKNFNLRV
jgi:hypothetical protein